MVSLLWQVYYGFRIQPICIFCKEGKHGHHVIPTARPAKSRLNSYMLSLTKSQPIECCLASLSFAQPLCQCDTVEQYPSRDPAIAKERSIRVFSKHAFTEATALLSHSERP